MLRLRTMPRRGRLRLVGFDYARAGGARVVEAYPVTEKGLIWGEAHPGYITAYEAAGFSEVHRPSKRRAVVSVTL